MQLKFILILFISFSLYGQNLSEILESVNSGKKVKLLNEQAYLEISKSELTSTYEAPEIELGLAHVDVKDGSDKGSEYSVGVSQNISYPFSSSSKSSALDMSQKAIKQNLKHEIHLLNLDISSKYHGTCVSKEMKNSAQALYSQQSQRLVKIKIAYELGEISKKDFLFYKLDLAKLKQSVSAYKRRYITDLSSLQERANTLNIQAVDCSDMQAPVRQLTLKDIDEHSEIKKISYQEGASNAMYNTYNSMFESVGYSVTYENELDARRYGFSLSLPISFLTSKKEKERTQYLHETSSLSTKKDILISELKLGTKSLELKLQTLYDELMMLENEILPLSQELYQLSISAQKSGKGNMMESIDAARSYKENLLEMLEIKKSYYEEYFELYKIADLELGEK